MTEQEKIRNRILKSGKLPTSPTAASPAAAGAFTPTEIFENVPKTPATSYALALANATVPKTTPKYNTSYAQTFAEMSSPKISTTPPTSYKDVKIPHSDMTYGELEEFRIKADETVKKIAEENAKAKVENDPFWKNYSTVPKPVGEGDSADMIFTPKDSSAKDVAMVSLSGTKNNGALYMPEGWEDIKEISPQRMIAVVPKIGNKVTEQFHSVKQPIETELNELYADLDELDARIYPHRHTLSISTTEEDKAAVREVLAPLEAEKTELEKKIAEKEARFQEVKSLERLLIYNEYQNVLKNDPESKRKIIDGQRLDDGNILKAYLTPDERQIYYYIVAEYGKVEARKFIGYFEDELRFRKAQFEYEYINDDPDGWLKKAALVYGGSFVDAVTGAWGGIKQFFSDKPVEKPYIVDTANYIKAQETGAAGVAYDVLGTLGYMTPAMLTATLTGTGVAGNLFTYLSGSGNAYSEKIKQGYSPAEAKIYSNLVGAAEAGLQYALGGISKLGKGANTGLIAQKIGSIENAFVRASTDLAYRGLKEITEEELQLFLEPFISSMVFNEKYDAPTMEEMLYTALISFATTGIFEIPEIAGEYSALRNNNKADKKLDSRLRSDNADADGEITRSVINEGLDSAPDTESYTYAERMRGRTDAGKKVSDRQLGHMYRANVEAVNSEETKTSIDANPYTHTPEQMKVIEEYVNSVDPKLAKFIVDSISNKGLNSTKYELKPVSSKAQADILALTGIDTAGFKTVIEQRMAEHIILRHGLKGKADQSMRDINDVSRMQYVIDNYDYIEDGGKTQAYSYFRDGKNRTAQTVKYVKAVNGTYYVVEAIPDSKKKTAFIISVYLQKKAENSAPYMPKPNATSETQALINSANNKISQPNPNVKYDFSLTPKESQIAEDEVLDFEDDSDAMYSEPSEEFDGRSFEELMGLDGTEASTPTSKVPEIKLPTAEDILSGNYTPATPVTTPVEEIKLKTGEEIVAEERAKEEALSSTKKFEDLSKIGKKQISDTSYDSSGMINTQPIKEDKGLWEKIKYGANFLDSKLIDSGRGVTKIAKETGDDKLYGYYNMARASQNIAAYMVMNAATDINGRATGKSLTAIFEPIHQKGKDYYRKFQEYLYHKHNIDRMSLLASEETLATVSSAFVDFQNSHPELNIYTPSQISEIAYTPEHELHEAAKEYMKLARLSDEVRRRENKPVFGPDASGKVPNAKESRIISDNLLAEHPEFAKYAKEVYSYLDNLMDYREASGLITPEQRAVLKKLYPNYVPTFRVTKKGEGRKNKNKVEIGSTIGKAEGGTTTLMPIEQALIQLTGQVVSEGTKNRFGSRLLNDVMKYSGEDYEKSPVAKYVVEEPTKADYFNGAEYYDDAVQRGEKDKATTNTFVVYKDGKRWQMKTNGLLYEAVSALDRNATEELNLMAKTNDVFKKLITEYNPAFLIRNGIKDIQEALFNSKDLSKFSQNYPIAIKEIATNGEYWQAYQALGGLNASLYDSPGLSSGASSDVTNGVKKIVDVYTFANVNRIIEQLPRFAEFVATVKKNGGIENASMDVLTEGMYNAAEVTTNFGRSGQWTKALNKYAVPFLNPAVQGASKAIRNVTSARSFSAWTRLIAKGVIFGFTPELLNYLFYSDDEDYESISDENKANYYLFKYDDGKFIKIPKGRYISALNYTFREVADALKGEKFDVVDTAKHVTDQIGVANPLTNNFIMPFVKVALTDDENPGETWYGSDIEGQSLQDLPVAERYDARTDELSKFIGKALNLSPKKINYLLNQYGGVLADVFLPMLTPAAENDFISANFTLDSTATNKYSGEYYDAKKKADYSANSIKATPYDTLSQKYWTDRTKGISEVNKVIREIEADESISDKDKKELLHVQYGIRNALYKTALDTSKKFDKVSREYYDKAPYKNNEDKLSYAFTMATRDVFGAEYALSSVNKTAYEEAAELTGSGISYDEYFDAYFTYDKIKADNKDSKVRRTEFAHWLNKNGKNMNSTERAALREALIGEGETSYDKLVGAGVSDKGAYEVGLKLDKLDPDPYSTYKTVQPYQKYRVIVNSLSDRDTVAAMKAISTDSQAKKIQSLADAGIDLELFADLAENIGKADKSIWNVSNSELQVWINRLSPPVLELNSRMTWPQIKSTMYSILTENKNNSSVPSSTHIKMVLDKHYGRTK